MGQQTRPLRPEELSRSPDTDPRRFRRGVTQGSPAMLFAFRDIGMAESGLVSALGLRSPKDHNDEAMSGAEMLRTTVEVVAAFGLSGLVVYACMRLRRRSWSVSRRDESMRRHINQHYS